MSNWSVSTYDINLDTYTLTGTIPRPQEDLEEERIATEQEEILADGSQAFIAPETKTNKRPLVFRWFQQSQSLKDQLFDYMANYDYLKITTHLGGVEYIGRFTSVVPKWLVGIEDSWDIQAIFTVEE